MILIGFGGNLPSSVGLPVATCRAALTALPGLGVEVRQVSPLYRSEPVPSSGQPWFVNGVAALETSLKAPDLLVRLHQVEEQFGRVRSSVRNAARTLDLDLLAYDDEVHTGEVEVPHPRMHLRAFVLAPLADLAPGWRHPILGKTAKDLLAALPPDQGLERFSHES